MTSAPIIIELLGAPRGKQAMAASQSDGHIYMPARTRDEMAAWRFAAKEAMAGRPPFAGPIRLKVSVVKPIPKSWSKREKNIAAIASLWAPVKPDHDNVTKMLDALNQLVWVDDCQIVDSHVTKVYGARPGVRLEIFELQGPNP